MKLVSYICFMQYAAIPNEVFESTFAKLVNYNIGIKKITRIWEIMKWTLILSCLITIPLLVIFIFLSNFCGNLLYPVVNKEILYQYAI